MHRTSIRRLAIGLAAGTFASFLLLTTSTAQQPANDVAIDADDIGGVVAGPKGRKLGCG